jgi:hypothetical protein
LIVDEEVAGDARDAGGADLAGPLLQQKDLLTNSKHLQCKVTLSTWLSVS